MISPVRHTSLFSQSGELEEPTKEDDPYQMDDYYSRKMSDEELIKSEEEATAYTAGSSASSVVGSLEAHSKAFIDKVRISSLCSFTEWQYMQFAIELRIYTSHGLGCRIWNLDQLYLRLQNFDLW